MPAPLHWFDPARPLYRGRDVRRAAANVLSTLQPVRPDEPSHESDERSALYRLASSVSGLTKTQARGLGLLSNRLHPAERPVFWRSVLLDLALRDVNSHGDERADLEIGPSAASAFTHRVYSKLGAATDDETPLKAPRLKPKRHRDLDEVLVPALLSRLSEHASRMNSAAVQDARRYLENKLKENFRDAPRVLGGPVLRSVSTAGESDRATRATRRELKARLEPQKVEGPKPSPPFLKRVRVLPHSDVPRVVDLREYGTLDTGKPFDMPFTRYHQRPLGVPLRVLEVVRERYRYWKNQEKR